MSAPKELSGKFITVEGIDGTGKTTQLGNLVENLIDQGVDPVVVKEPGDKVNGTYIGSEIGAQVRNMIFFDPTSNIMDPDVTDLLFLADHIQLWKKTIVPALAAGRTVVSDRYADSQFAYGVVKGSSDWIMRLYREQYGPMPDATILLIGDPKFLYPRTKRAGTAEAGKQDGKRWAGIDDQEIIKRAYQLQLANQPRTVVVEVTPEKSITMVEAEIWSGLLKVLYRKDNDEEQIELFPDGARSAGV